MITSQWIKITIEHEHKSKLIIFKLVNKVDKLFGSKKAMTTINNLIIFLKLC
jgi:hypothetical protein